MTLDTRAIETLNRAEATLYGLARDLRVVSDVVRIEMTSEAFAEKISALANMLEAESRVLAGNLHSMGLRRPPAGG